MNIDTTQARIKYTPVVNRVEGNKPVANRVQQQATKNRVQQQAVTNRVAGNTPVANRVDIAA